VIAPARTGKLYTYKKAVMKQKMVLNRHWLALNNLTIAKCSMLKQLIYLDYIFILNQPWDIMLTNILYLVSKVDLG